MKQTPEDFYAGCAGKTAFPSAHAAYRTMRNGRALKAAYAYRCGFCSQWHITRGSR